MHLPVAAAVIGKDADTFVFEIALFFFSGEQIRSHVGGAAAKDAGNNVGAAHPEGFFEVIAREVRWGIGMRMIEPHDAEAAFTSVALNLDQLLGSDLIAGTGGLAASVGTAYDLADKVVNSGDVTEQNSAALIGIGEFTVGADGVEIVLREYEQIRLWLPEYSA